MRYLIIIFSLILFTDASAEITKIRISFASEMPMKALEKENSKANLIMFVGGGGLKHGKLGKVKNPLIRARSNFIKAGFNLYFFPNPKKGKKISLKYRKSKTHADNILKVSKLLKKRNNLPTILVGHSRGGTSVSNAAVIHGSKLDGIVNAAAMTATSSKVSSGYLITNILKKGVDTHVLIIHPKKDTCMVTPYGPIPKLVKKLKAKSKKLVTIDGGGTTGRDCGPLHRHGFENTEKELAASIMNWVSGL